MKIMKLYNAGKKVKEITAKMICAANKVKQYMVILGSGILTIALTSCKSVRISSGGSSAVSIIGGSDGITSVFVAGKIGSSTMPVFIILGFIVILAIVSYLCYKKKKNNKKK